MGKLPKKYIKQYGITKEAWRKYRASLGKRTTKRSSPKTKTKRRGRKTVKKKRRRRRSYKVPLAPTIAAVSTLVSRCPSGRTILDDLKAFDMDALIYDAREKFVGIDANGQFQWSWVVNTYLPIIIGGLVHKVASAVGVNRHLGKIPIIGKYLSI